MKTIIREASAMIAGMTPELTDGIFVFCTTADADIAADCFKVAIGIFREAEGYSFILAVEHAVTFGFDCAAPMHRISLRVFSALDGVGLTAAVAHALARQGIACNMVAAYHHDHVFVPAAQADTAYSVLTALQNEGRVST